MTIAAIAAICGVLVLLVHEVVGHGLATMLLGGHLVRVTSIDSSYNGAVTTTAMRIIAAAGIAANLLFGVLALRLLAAVPKRFARTRYFLWLFGHATMFLGSGYLFAFSLIGAGDVEASIQGLPLELAWRAAAALLGLFIYRSAFYDAAHTLGDWLGQTGEHRVRTLTIIPYFVISISITIAGLLNPTGAIYGAGWAAAATVGGNAALLFLPSAVDGEAELAEPFDLSFSWNWLLAGVAALTALFAVLAPGVPR